MHKKNILFISHGPLMKDIRTRGEELAKVLSKKHNVFFLTYKTKYKGPITSKILFKIKQHFFKIKEFKYENFLAIEVPYSTLYGIKGLKKREFSRYSIKFNKKILKKIIEKRKINLIISEAFDGFDVSDLKIPYIYDIVDISPFGDYSKFIKKQIENASHITSISYYIKKELNKDYVEVIPNGLNFREIKRAKKFRKDKKVIGFIGNHDWWAGVPFLLDSFKEFKKNNSNKNVELWIIGGGKQIPEAKEKVRKEQIKDVKFLGKIPKEKIYSYYKTIDLGVLPFKKTRLTDACIPLKILEYAGAKKIILSSDLKELKKIKLSGLFLVKRNPKLWAEKMKKLLNKKWQKSWNKELLFYSWENLAKKLEKIVDSL